MDGFNSRFRFTFCISLLLILFFGNVLVYGRHRRHANNYNNYPSNYPSPQGSYQPNYQPSSSGSHLYPSLDNVDERSNVNFYYNKNRTVPVLDFSNGQIDPGFAPYPRYYGPNATYVPNFNFDSGNPNRLPNRYNNSRAWNNTYNPNNRYPTNNYPNINLQNQPDGGLISQDNLPSPRTTCGKTLCSYVASYPTNEISTAVDRARDILRSGSVSPALRNKGISFETFNSRKPSSPASGNRGSDPSGTCYTNTNTVYPHEGFSSDDGKAYYIVNIPGLDQATSNVECNGGSGQTCSNQRVGVPSSAARTCQQLYRKERLLALPIGKRYFDVDDFHFQTFHVPAGCSCLPIRRGY